MESKPSYHANSSYKFSTPLYQRFQIEGHPTDCDGILNVLSFDAVPDFEPKRAFWIWGGRGKYVRGRHALKKSRQLLVAVCGCVQVQVMTPSNQELEARFDLWRPDEGLLLEPPCWRRLLFRDRMATLLVIATEPYSEDDYIRDYDEWRKYCDTLIQATE